MDKDVLARIEDTFKRLSTNAGHLPQATFLRDVMGDGMPAKLAEVCNWRGNRGRRREEGGGGGRGGGRRERGRDGDVGREVKGN